MRKLITIVILVVTMFLFTANVSYGFGDVKNSNSNRNTNKNTNEVNQNQGQGQSQINEGNTTEIGIETNIMNPAPLMDTPGFIGPNYKTVLDNSWTSNPFELGKVSFTVKELTRFANPSKALGIFWYEWNKSFQIEMACWAKSKPQKNIRVYTHAIGLDGYEKIGEAHGRAVELHKSEKQVAAALCVFAANKGAKIVVIRTFSNPVTKADSAVLGGAGASVTGAGNIVNSAGGFGWTTAEKVFRSYVVAELYKNKSAAHLLKNPYLKPTSKIQMDLTEQDFDRHNLSPQMKQYVKKYVTFTK